MPDDTMTYERESGHENTVMTDETMTYEKESGHENISDIKKNEKRLKKISKKFAHLKNICTFAIELRKRSSLRP